MIGAWESDVRETRQRGLMRFTFTFTADGALAAAALPIAGPGAQPLYRAGTYRLHGGQLQSDAVNEGQPVSVRFENEVLLLQFDAGLSFRLRRIGNG